MLPEDPLAWTAGRSPRNYLFVGWRWLPLLRDEPRVQVVTLAIRWNSPRLPRTLASPEDYARPSGAPRARICTGVVCISTARGQPPGDMGTSDALVSKVGVAAISAFVQVPGATDTWPIHESATCFSRAVRECSEEGTSLSIAVPAPIAATI